MAHSSKDAIDEALAREESDPERESLLQRADEKAEEAGAAYDRDPIGVLKKSNRSYLYPIVSPDFDKAIGVKL